MCHKASSFWAQCPVTERTGLHNLSFKNTCIPCREKLKINYNYCWGQSLPEQLSNKAWSISDFNQSGKKKIADPTNTLSLLQSFTSYSLTSSTTFKALQDPVLVKYYCNVRAALWQKAAFRRSGEPLICLLWKPQPLLLIPWWVRLFRLNTWAVAALEWHCP